MRGIEAVDKIERATLLCRKAQRAVRRFPIRIFSSLEFAFSVLAIKAEHDLPNVIWKRRDGINDNVRVVLVQPRCSVEPVDRLRRDSPRKDRVLMHTQSQTNV